MSVPNLCPLLVIVTAVLSQTAGQGVTLTVEKDKLVTLPCQQGDVPEFITKTWYQQYHRYYPRTIYKQNSSGTVTFHRARSDMSLDTTNFHLTIGRVQLEDNDNFTCQVETKDQTATTPVWLKVYSKMLTAEENTSVILLCKDGDKTDFISKSWYWGLYTNRIVHNGSATIYNQVSSGTVGSRGTRSDMSLDTTNFHLTIGRVQLEDNSDFTCRVATLEGTTFEPVHLDVYIQAKIMLAGLEQTTFTENTTVTVTCTIHRVYPALRPGDFYIQLATQDIKSVGVMSAHTDGSYKYTAKLTHRLTRGDDGTYVSCSVTPLRGQPDSISQIITVHYYSGDPAVLDVTPSNPDTDQVVTFTCSHGTVIDNPPVDSVAWYKDGQQLTDWPNNLLKHSMKVTTADSGLYSCVVGNVVGFSAMSLAVHLNVSTIVYQVPPPSPSVVPAAIGGTVGVVLVIVIIIVVVFCCKRSEKVKDSKRRRDKCFQNAGYTADSYESPMPSTMAPHPPKDRTRDIASAYLTTTFTATEGAADGENEYEDVKCVDYDDTNLPRTCQDDGFPQDPGHQYEPLRKKGNDIPDLTSWLRQNNVSVNTCYKLQQEEIKNVQTLKMMKKETIRGLKISVGEQLRLWACIQKLS